MSGSYNKKYPAEEARRKRYQASYDAAKARRADVLARKRLIVPGVTRISGAYTRSMPGSGETHYNDQTFSFSPPAVGNNTVNNTFPTLVCVSPTSGAPSNPVNTPSLFAISQGTTKNQRIGNKIHAYQVRVNMVCLVPSANNAGEILRVLLVHDKQCNGATPTPGDILEQGVGATVAAGTGLTSFANMDNVDRFTILKDKKYTLNPSAAGGGAAGSFPFYINMKMNKKINLRVDYSSTTGAVSEIKSNNIFIMAYSAVNGVLCTGTARVYWKE